jgi:hypothetical protein
MVETAKSSLFQAMAISGALILDRGLMEAPLEVAQNKAIPLASWKSTSFGTVLYLTYPSSPAEDLPAVWWTFFVRKGADWLQQLPWIAAEVWRGIAGPPKTVDGLDGRSITEGGRTRRSLSSHGPPVTLVWGWTSSEVSRLSLFQQGRDPEQFLSGHFGTWIIGSDSENRWRVSAYDVEGTLLDTISGQDH